MAPAPMDVQVVDALEACDRLWIMLSSDVTDSLYTMLELCVWHATRRIHPTTTTLLNHVSVTSIAGRTLPLPVVDPHRDHAHWLHRQLSKHGAVGRAVVETVAARTHVDVRQADVVRETLRAVEALAATAPEPPAASFYAPKHHWRTDAKPASDFDYGWIEDRPRTWDGCLTPRAAGRTPSSQRHPPTAHTWPRPGLVVVHRPP